MRTPANRVPPLNGRLGAELCAGAGLTVEPWLFWADDQDRLDANDLGDTRIDPDGTAGYAIANLRVGFDTGDAWRLQLDLSNLLDQPYREHGSGIDGPGLGVALTLQVRFQ